MDGELELPEMTLTLDLQSFLAWLSMAIVVSVVLAKVIGRRRTIVDSLIDAAPGVNNSLSARYRLVKQLGRGASSDVWLAEQLFSGRQVAVKVYRPSESNPADRERLEREARVATALSSPQAPQFI